MLTQEQERVIIKRVIGGDIDAFEDLLNANQKNVYNLALKLTGNQSDAEDITQEAFFKAYRLLDTFRGDSRFSVWMYRLTYNLCIDFIRKNNRTPTVPLTFTDDTGTESALEIPDNRETPEKALMRRELNEAITKSINELDYSQREIIVLREVTGMSYSDIAQTLDINEGTVKSRLSRARKSLADILLNKSFGTFSSDIRPNEGRSEA